MKRVQFIFEGRSREYLLFVPPNPSGLVVFLPGTGGTAAWADSETGWSRSAMQERFALAIPEGLPPDPLLPPKFLTNPPRWNDGNEFAANKTIGGKTESILLNNLPNDTGEMKPPATDTPSPSPDLSSVQKQADDVGFLTTVLDDVANQLGTQSLPVFLTGFSNGAGMTFRFAAEQANRITAIAPVAGYCWVAEPKPVRPVPTLYVVGTADPLIPLRGGNMRSPWTNRLIHRPPVSDTLERWAHAIGCGIPPIPESEQGSVRIDIYPGPVPYRSITIDGLGHHWPGGKGQLNPRIAGPPTQAVNGTELVWEFFKQFV